MKTKKILKKNKYLIVYSSILIVLLGFILSFYVVNSNADDYCWNYSVSSWSCKIDKNTCTDRVNWVKTCSWTRKDVYTRTTNYFCGNWKWIGTESRARYSISSVCTQQITDYIAPDVDVNRDWWVK